MTFEQENRVKADFDDAYTAPTPHAYLAAMAENGYAIGEQARPWFVAAAELLAEHNGTAFPVQMLDLGCSYGVGAALVRFGVTFDEMVAFFTSRAPRNYTACTESTRSWLNATPPQLDLRVIGMDASGPAIRFATDACMLDNGIVANLEAPGAAPDDEQRAFFRSCNLVVSSGAIGYITGRTLDHVLADLGADHPGKFGPLVVVTILRMFDAGPIVEAFRKVDMRFEAVPGVRLPQRRFVDETEQRRTLDLLASRDVDTAGWESEGVLVADLYVGAPAASFGPLMERMRAIEVDVAPRAR
ncbi:MAG: hypothetical protein AB7K09_13680 [Planctomycetota bacterium]